MKSILAIDAAWTEKEPSGVALITDEDGRWLCNLLAPSYRQFVDLCFGNEIDWTQKPVGSLLKIKKLISACEEYLSSPPSIITFDMPMSLQPIVGRREADRAISRAYGGKGCAAHSPSSIRPGPISDACRLACDESGYKLATSQTPVGKSKCVLEVYPHPALLKLLDVDYRVPYKASKYRKYWPDVTSQEGKNRLVSVLESILRELKSQISGIAFVLPDDLALRPISEFKRYEDAIDALVCAWVGIKYLERAAMPYGDENGAVWVPMDRAEI